MSQMGCVVHRNGGVRGRRFFQPGGYFGVERLDYLIPKILTSDLEQYWAV